MPDLAVLGALVPALTVLATAVMAVSGAIQAVRHGFDPFGGTVLAVVTAVGGGTLRDLMVGRFPVFWIADTTYLLTAAPVGMIAYLLAARLPAGGGRRLRLLLYFDAVGLALFTLVGIRVAMSFDVPAVSAVVLGCVTGIGGGIFRDVLSGITPEVLRRDLYATISLAGGAVYLLLEGRVPEEIQLALAFGLMTAARVAVVSRSTAPAN